MISNIALIRNATSQNYPEFEYATSIVNKCLTKLPAYLFLLLAVILLNTASTAKSESYITANISSYHINASRDYNEHNPGLGFGYFTGDRLQYGIETGFFKNSFYDQSTYLMGFADYPVFTVGNVEFRAGAWIGFFKYNNLVKTADRFGIPRIGNHVLFGGLHATARFGAFDTKVRLSPSGKHSDAILTFQIAYNF